MRNPNPIAEDNLKKYGKPPTWEQIDCLIKESGISSIYNFEKYYSIVFNHLAKVRCGERQLCRSYWHIFFERLTPDRFVKTTIPKTITKRIPKVIPTTYRVATDSASVAYQPGNPTNVVDTCDKSQDEHDRTNNLK